MTEIIEEQESTQPDFERYLDVARRRHMYFLAVVSGLAPRMGKQLVTADELQIEHADSR